MDIVPERKTGTTMDTKPALKTGTAKDIKKAMMKDTSMGRLMDTTKQQATFLQNFYFGETVLF